MKKLTVDDIMNATDNPLFFGWKDLKPLLNLRSAWDQKWLFFLTSGRSIGKSTTIARYFMADFIVNGVKWLYMRRTDKVLWEGQKRFFDKAISIFNDHNLGFKITYFSLEAGQYYVTIDWDDEDYKVEKYDKNGELIEMTREEQLEAEKKDRKNRAQFAGIAHSLAAYEKAKGAGFDGLGIRHFCFDEFMAEQTVDYLGTKDNNLVEWDDILSIYASIDRDIGKPFLNECDVFCLGNKAHDFNPILLGAGFNEYHAQSPNAHVISPKYEEWVYYNVEGSEEFKKLAKQSRLYRAMKHDERLRKYNFDNESKDEGISDELISKDTPKGCIYFSGVTLNGKQYGIYRRESDGLIYVGKPVKGKYMEALDLGSYSNGDVVALVKQWRRSPALNIIYERFLVKKVLFCNKAAAQAFLKYLDFIPR